MALDPITRASTGLGLATAADLTAAGHDVVLHARSLDRLADLKLCDRVYDLASADPVLADLADADQTLRLAEHR